MKTHRTQLRGGGRSIKCAAGVRGPRGRGTCKSEYQQDLGSLGGSQMLLGSLCSQPSLLPQIPRSAGPQFDMDQRGCAPVPSAPSGWTSTPGRPIGPWLVQSAMVRCGVALYTHGCARPLSRRWETKYSSEIGGLSQVSTQKWVSFRPGH